MESISVGALMPEILMPNAEVLEMIMPKVMISDTALPDNSVGQRGDSTNYGFDYWPSHILIMSPPIKWGGILFLALLLVCPAFVSALDLLFRKHPSSCKWFLQTSQT